MKTQRQALVTGATGFIGSHLIRALESAGWLVAVVSRGCEKDAYGIMRICEPDVVFHLASLFLANHTTDDVARLTASNIEFGTHVLDAMAQAGVKRIVNAGTFWQHPAPVNLYAATKQAFESIVDYYVRADGIRAITLKLFDTYGPGDNRPKLMQTLCNSLDSDKRLSFALPDERISLVHVDDVCRAFIAAADRLMNEERHGHERFSVWNGYTTLGDVAEMFYRVSGKIPPIDWGTRPSRNPRPDIEPHDPILPGWSPQVSLKEGIAGILA